jgi:hydrogenase maturation protease
MAGPLIVGYGNTLRGDDGVGWHAADRLADDPRVSHATVVRCHQLTPELALDISQASLVVFVDASVLVAAGEIIVRAIEPTSTDSPSTHHVTPGSLLTLSQALYGSAAPATLVSIGCETLEAGDGLSPVVARALDTVLETVVDLVREPARA